jgi:hypothetical protein
MGTCCRSPTRRHVRPAKSDNNAGLLQVLLQLCGIVDPHSSRHIANNLYRVGLASDCDDKDPGCEFRWQVVMSDSAPFMLALYSVAVICMLHPLSPFPYSFSDYFNINGSKLDSVVDIENR